MATVNPGRRRRRMGFAGTLGCGSRWWFLWHGRPHEPGAKSSRVKTAVHVQRKPLVVGVNQFDTTDGE